MTSLILDIERDPFPSPRIDGWENPLMGFGTWRDKVSAGRYTSSVRLDDQQLSDLFYTDDIAAKIIEKRPEEAFRRGYELEGPGAKELVKKAAALDADAKLQEAMIWGRLYGGSLLIVGAEQGQPWTPLQVEKVRDVKYLTVVDRRNIYVERRYRDPLAPNFNEPEVYGITNPGGGMTVFVHASRCIRFDGVRADRQKQWEFDSWSYSVLQRPYDVIRQFATAFQSAGVLTADASQAVFKIKGLFEMITSGEKKNLQTRMQLVDMTRSALRAVLLDADGEDFTRIATQFQGLPEMLDRFAARLAASIDMPVTLLMGTTPAGDNATGASDFKHWYDSVRSEQEKSLTPKVLRLYQILSAGKSDQLKVCWHKLEEPSAKEEAETQKIEAETDDIRIRSGVLYPQEVALARYSDATNGAIKIDVEGRKAELEAEKELTLNPPAPVLPGAPAAPGDTPPSTSTSETGADLSGK